MTFALFQLSFYLILVFFIKDRIDTLWISNKINSVVDFNLSKYDSIYNFGFNEPSLVFLTSHKSKKLHPQNLDADYKNSNKILFIVTEELSENFNDNILSDFRLINEFEGFNYSKGKDVKFLIFDNIKNE